MEGRGPDEVRPELRHAQDLREFKRRIREVYLPSFLSDYGYEPGGYKGNDEEVLPVDAHWILRAIDEGVVSLEAGGRLKLPASSVPTGLFWEGRRATSPRPVTLSYEAVLSGGMAARLHFEFGWPVESLGFEYPPGRQAPGRRAFDLAAIDGSGSLAIAGEAKNTTAELDRLFKVMRECESLGQHDHEKRDPRRNGHNKWIGLLRCRPWVFFAFGPGEDWSIFRVLYAPDGSLSFHSGSVGLLHHQEPPASG